MKQFFAIAVLLIAGSMADAQCIGGSCPVPSRGPSVSAANSGSRRTPIRTVLSKIFRR